MWRGGLARWTVGSVCLGRAKDPWVGEGEACGSVLCLCMWVCVRECKILGRGGKYV